MKTELTVARLRELLHYDPTTGVFTNATTRNRCAIAGHRAGWIDPNGYQTIKIFRKAYLAHRLAWFYVHGEWPAQQIDHINQVRHDNRIDNLRDVSPAVNQQNVRHAQRNNRSGILGVCKNKTRHSAVIEADGKRFYLGCFATPEEAGAVYADAKARLHAKAISR